MTKSRSSDDVAARIMRYLEMHPGVCDSLDGIVRWWLDRTPEEDWQPVTEAALAQLVASGRIEEDVDGEGRPVYRRARARRP